MREWSRALTARFLRVPGDADDKYSRGVVALRTGSSEYPGAAVLGVEAAWRAGAGFVRYVGAGRAADAVIARRPETVAGIDTGRTRIDAWVIGSGTDPETRSDQETAALRTILDGDVPVVADAGALDLAITGTAPRVLTPHAGEFARLWPKDGAAADPIEAVRRVAADTGTVVLLKGARTLIVSPDGGVIAVREAPGWLATAGAGDVLAGVIAALIAANPDAVLAEVTAAGAWLHASAARIASGARAGEPGRPIVALDVAEALPRAIADVLR